VKMLPATLLTIMAFVGVLYPMYCGSLVMAQKPGYDWFPPTAND
jgi:hypothetical protein